MKITSAKFAFSSGKLSQIPRDGLREFAFIGRSNVGKSSLINMLTAKKDMAKVSGTPGKTRLINHFLVNNQWYLVDLPGYGYARASKSIRAGFDKLITDYVSKADKLWFLFVLVDARHEPQKIDMEFLTMLGENGIPFGVVFTKADKLGTNALASNVANYKQTLLKQWEELPPMFISSSEKRLGADEILDFIDSALNQPD
jgi:GTP-binding protein